MALDEIAADSPESVREFVREAFTLEKSKTTWETITCKHCSRPGKYEITVSVPDFKARAQAVDLLLTQSKGRPQERLELTMQTQDTRASKIEDLTTEQLRLLADRKMVLEESESGHLRLVPPPLDEGAAA